MSTPRGHSHVEQVVHPATLPRLSIARDDDPAGDGAMATLIDRARQAGIEPIVISPRLGDFNEDFRLLGIDALRAAGRTQTAAACRASGVPASRTTSPDRYRKSGHRTSRRSPSCPGLHPGISQPP